MVTPDNSIPVKTPYTVPLSSGRVVVVTPRKDQPSVSDISIADGQEMTEAEWDEYCALVVAGKDGRQ